MMYQFLHFAGWPSLPKPSYPFSRPPPPSSLPTLSRRPWRNGIHGGFNVKMAESLYAFWAFWTRNLCLKPSTWVKNTVFCGVKWYHQTKKNPHKWNDQRKLVQVKDHDSDSWKVSGFIQSNEFLLLVGLSPTKRGKPVEVRTTSVYYWVVVVHCFLFV